MLELNRLRLLREFALRGTVTATAEALYLTPSAVSQQLDLLAKEAGVVLLRRRGRRLELTDAGERLVAHAENIITEVERAEADLAHSAHIVCGTVRIAAFPTAAQTVVPYAIQLLQQRYPELRIILKVLEPFESFPLLRQGDLDIAVVHEYDLLPADREPGYIYHFLFADPQLIALPPEHPANAEAVTLTSLKDEKWIAGEEDTSCYDITVRACALANFSPKIDFYSNDYGVIMGLVEAGLAVSFVPQLALQKHSTKATFRPLVERALERRIFAVHREGKAESPIYQAVVAALKEFLP